LLLGRQHLGGRVGPRHRRNVGRSGCLLVD
jgi:hypothetical protein